MVGKITATASATVLTEPSLVKEIKKFVLLICLVAFSTASLSLITWGSWLREAYPNFMSVAGIIIIAIATIIAYVPEGLPICVTLTLSIIAKQMFKQRVLVKNLPAVETLGSVK